MTRYGMFLALWAVISLGFGWWLAGVVLSPSDRPADTDPVSPDCIVGTGAMHAASIPTDAVLSCYFLVPCGATTTLVQGVFVDKGDGVIEMVMP